jgi:hypothetical protein
MAMNAEDLIRQQIRLEYNLSADGRLVPYPGSTEMARYVVHRHTEGCVRFYRNDLPPRVMQDLAALPAETAFDDPEAVVSILADHAACTNMFFGTGAVFVELPSLDACPAVTEGGHEFVVMAGGVKASAAWSVRENADAAELAVETAEGFRRRGYGRQVASAWAHHVMRQGKTAFYSYAGHNVASRALARSLGVVEFSTVAAYD